MKKIKLNCWKSSISLNPLLYKTHKLSPSQAPQLVYPEILATRLTNLKQKFAKMEKMRFDLQSLQSFTQGLSGFCPPHMQPSTTVSWPPQNMESMDVLAFPGPSKTSEAVVTGPVLPPGFQKLSSVVAGVTGSVLSPSLPQTWVMIRE